ncbi:MAG: (d)CMP kinase [Deltaproteobacteria bacterium]|nr:MAG: (d)CMP kinase [Deltaproteobacteria bacterium]
MTTRVRRRPIVVAIDGPAGAGKSTVSKRLAADLGYRLLDTGALYRAVALEARRRGVAWDDEPALARLAADLDVTFELVAGENRVRVAGEDVSDAIRAPEISDGASRVSALPAVRAALLGVQRRLGARGGVVAEGRDIGTVVFPGAEAKFFLTASPEARARRRWDELQAKGIAADFEEIASAMAERDRRDAERAVAPLRAAPDAVVVDSSDLSVDEVVARLRRAVRAKERARAQTPRND